jgi:hypothetical protein
MLKFGLYVSALIIAICVGHRPVEAQAVCVDGCKQFMYGKRVGTATTPTAAACRDQCRANATCNAWMYWVDGAHARQCEMVGARYDMDKSVSQMNVISGIVRPR